MRSSLSFSFPCTHRTKQTLTLCVAPARSFCSLLLASMLFTSRIVVPLLSRSSAAGSAAQQQKRKAVAGIKEAQQQQQASSTAVKGAAKTGSVRERKNQ